MNISEFRVEMNNEGNYYKELCYRIENGYIISVVNVNPKTLLDKPTSLGYYINPNELKSFFTYTVDNNRHKCTNMILDYYNVPSENMNVRERLAYYQLLGNDKND